MKYWVLDSQIIVNDGVNSWSISSSDFRYTTIKDHLLKHEYHNALTLLNPKLPENFSILNGRIMFKTMALPDIFHDLLFKKLYPSEGYLQAIANHWWNKYSRDPQNSIADLDTFNKMALNAKPITKCGFHFVSSTDLQTSAYYHHTVGNWPIDKYPLVDEHLHILHQKGRLGGHSPNTILKYVLQPNLNYNPLIYLKIRKVLPFLPIISSFITQGRGSFEPSTYIPTLKKIPRSWSKKFFLGHGFRGLDLIVNHPGLDFIISQGVTPESWEDLARMLRLIRERYSFPKYQSYRSDKFELIPPASNLELIQWSNYLKNCAHGEIYEKKVLEQKSLIFGFFESDKKSRILKGMIEIGLPNRDLLQFTVLANGGQEKAPDTLYKTIKSYLIEQKLIMV